MKAGRKNLLLSLLFSLIFACSPEPPKITNFYNSGHPYKTIARKPPPAANDPENPKKANKTANLISAKANLDHTGVTSIPKNSVGYQPIVSNANEVPELLASASNDNSWLAIYSAEQVSFNSFPLKTSEIKPSFKNPNPAQKEAIKPAAKAGEKQSITVQQRAEQKQDNSVSILFGLSGLLSVGLLGANLKKIRKISEWASQNRAKSRALLFSIRIFTAISAVVAGNYFADQGILISEFGKEVAISVCTAAAVLYPIRNSRYRVFKSNYFRQKLFDIALFSSGTFMLLSAANQYDLTTRPAAAEQTIFSTATFSGQNHSVSLVKTSTDLRSDNPDEAKPPKKKSTVAKIALTVLAVAVFAFLTMLLGALACNLACAGYGAVSYLVFFAGEAGAIVLLVKSLKWVFGKKKITPEMQQPAPGKN